MVQNTSGLNFYQVKSAKLGICMDKNKNFLTSASGLVILAIAFLGFCASVVVVGSLIGMYSVRQMTPLTATIIPSLTVVPATITPTVTITVSPTPTAIPTMDADSAYTVNTLKNTIVPESNLIDLACRLKGKCNFPEMVPSGPFKVGARQMFWISNADSAKNFQVKATLAYLTETAYFWVEDGVSFRQDEAQKLVDTFSQKIYSTDREFFGNEPSPGIDADVHIYILYARGLGNVGGYFSPYDTIPPQANEHSNAHEMFVFNADVSPLSAPYTYTTLAHEFVHMIQWSYDRNDVSWINEGFAELGAFLNGYWIGGADGVFVQKPDLQLNTWVSPSSPDFGPHYGMSFLYLTYFLDRFGEKATKALTDNLNNDLTSVDDTLATLDITDAQTGQPISTEDVFMDWAAAMYLHDGAVGDGRFTYHNYPQAPHTGDSGWLGCDPGTHAFTVHQYGIDYLKIACPGKITLHFKGSKQTSLLPAEAFSGKLAFWSNKGDLSDMTLTRAFDFSSVSGPLTLNYHTWYDLEKGYDYAYLEASSDGGKTWQILKTPSGTDENPSGNSYGWGYNAQSAGWSAESVDLSQFAGQKIQLRFEYITDTAINGEGLLLDDISIPETGYFTDFESDAGGWQAAGFVRVENSLPQTFRLMLITNNHTTQVQTIQVAPDQTAEIPLDLIADNSTATLIVTGTTRYTTAEASYSITFK
jgi:immune inhibitor A